MTSRMPGDDEICRFERGGESAFTAAVAGGSPSVETMETPQCANCANCALAFSSGEGSYASGDCAKLVVCDSIEKLRERGVENLLHIVFN